MAIRFPAAAMVVGYVSRGRGRGLFAVIIVLVVTVPSPLYPSFDNTDTNKGQVDGRPGGFNCTGVPDCERRDFKNRFKNRDRIITFKGNIINGLMD